MTEFTVTDSEVSGKCQDIKFSFKKRDDDPDVVVFSPRGTVTVDIKNSRVIFDLDLVRLARSRDVRQKKSAGQRVEELLDNVSTEYQILDKMVRLLDERDRPFFEGARQALRWLMFPEETLRPSSMDKFLTKREKS